VGKKKIKIMESVLKGLAIFIGTVTLVALVMGLPLMLLWNWLMPILFGLPTITFGQAIGLNFLCTLIFGKTSFKTKS
jgi:membrane protein required for beta-lactamase induction